MMGNWQKAIAFFDEIGFSLDNKEFEDRLIAQKTICLLELKNLDFDYIFNLYVRGPYSPVFTTDYYQHGDEFKNNDTPLTLSEDEIATVTYLDKLFEKSPSLLEIGATYGFLLKEGGMSAVDAYNIVKQEKGFYQDSLIAKGVSKAKQFLFEPTSDDLEWLKNEVRPWQKAAIASMRHHG